MSYTSGMVAMIYSYQFNDAAIVSAKENDYRIHFWHMSKNDAINMMKSSDLNEKRGSL